MNDYYKFCMLLLVLLLVCYITGSIAKRCLLDKTSTSTNGWYCCDNHEEINGNCVGCKIGYISDNGELCHKCLYGWYGLKCGLTCNCKDTERCHHIDGCTAAETTVIVGTELTNDNHHRVTYGASQSLFTIKSTNDESISDLASVGNKLGGITTDDGNIIVGPLKTTSIGVLAYLICAGGLTCIVLFSLCLYRYRYILTNCNQQPRAVLESNILQNNVPMPAEHNGYFEDEYEIIDESKMLDDLL